MDPKSLQTWLPLLIVAVVFVFRYRAISRPKPFRPGRLWIAPAIVFALLAFILLTLPPTPTGWLVVLGGLALGSVVGWKRGQLLHLERDPVGGGLLIRQSPAALLLLLFIFVVRRGVSVGLDAGTGDPAHPSAIAMLVTDGLLGFALGMVVAMRMTLWLRAKALPAADRGGD